jgi:hypothetical protein
MTKLLLSGAGVVLAVSMIVFAYVEHANSADGAAQEAARATYGIFMRENADKPFAEQHLAAHRMGQKLYQELGIDGFGVCDESFAFGCYHGFFGGVIADKGPSVVRELADSCRKRFGENSTGCEHGIGHGLIEHFGREGLVVALELCDTTRQKHPLFGCTGGVFMEYNSAITFPDGSAVVDERKPDPDNLHVPCTEVPAQYRTSCYFEIGLWWKQVLGDDYARIGNMCRDAAQESEQKACAQGWGTVIAENVAYDPEEAGALCGAIKDAPLVDACILGVAMRFFGSGTHEDEGRRMCDLIGGERAQECKSLAV